MNAGLPAIGIDIGGSSIKAALLMPGKDPKKSVSARYEATDAPSIEAAIRDAVRQLQPPTDVRQVGLCVPGLRSDDGLTVLRSVNLPGLTGLRLDSLVHRVLGTSCRSPVVTSDVHAAAISIHADDPSPGRLLVVALGTGVGACVLDDGVRLKLSGESSGHLGQIDVSLETATEPIPIGPDGGRGSLEAYIGLPALEARYGRHLEHACAVMNEESPPLRALARAIRVAHAIYRPDRMVLAGGIGVMLRPRFSILQTMVARDLTSLARPGWRMECATDLFHAAVGAARLAAAV